MLHITLFDQDLARLEAELLHLRLGERLAFLELLNLQIQIAAHGSVEKTAEADGRLAVQCRQPSRPGAEERVGKRGQRRLDAVSPWAEDGGGCELSACGGRLPDARVLPMREQERMRDADAFWMPTRCKDAEPVTMRWEAGLCCMCAVMGRSEDADVGDGSVRA
ncbi:hypothetical protein L1887_47103 [Cichorium endivia]|nr:hypothetical protein L1887_47103 [Cichorium endivia]